MLRGTTRVDPLVFLLIFEFVHYIKLRDEFIYDYLLITTNKTKDEIFDELSKVVIF